MLSMEERMTRLENEINKIKKENHSLLGEVDKLKKDNHSLLGEVDKLKKENHSLLCKYNVLLGERELEIFYQRYLEKKYGATHTKGMFGITDIETEDKVIEIKRWNKYKEALGQLLSYTSKLHKKDINVCSKPKKPVVYFFGDKPKHADNIISIFKVNNISTFYLQTTCNNDIVEEELCNSLETDSFYKWLTDNVEECQDSLLNLTEIVKLYDANQNLHSKMLKPFRVTVERYIFNNHPHIKHHHGKIRIGDKTHTGWKNLIIK